MNRILITGSNGFIGQHLQVALRASGFEVALADFPNFDLRVPKSIDAALSGGAYGTIIHLAGMSHVQDCQKNPALAMTVNRDGTEKMLDFMLRQKTKIHFIFASTAQVYAAPEGSEINGQVIFSEERKTDPQNLYAETKYQSELLVRAAAATEKMDATILRLFNHTHKSQSPHFFLPHVYHQLLQSSGQPIPVGNLDLDRDIGSVRDLTRAFTEILRHKQKWNFELFNVCSGASKNLRRLALGLSERLKIKAEFVMDSERARLGEAKSLVGSHAKLTKAIGWQPLIVTENQLLDDFLCE